MLKTRGLEGVALASVAHGVAIQKWVKSLLGSLIFPFIPKII